MKEMIFSSPRNIFTAFLVLLLIWFFTRIVVFVKALRYVRDVNHVQAGGFMMERSIFGGEVIAQAKMITGIVCRFIAAFEIVLVILLLMYG